MSIAQNIEVIRSRIADAAACAGREPGEVLLVAASKTNPPEPIRQAIAAGVNACGENRVQEMVEKYNAGAYAGAPLHFIGHLQRNKVRQVVSLADLIQSADSAELIRLVNARAGALGITQDILLEINIAGEQSKSGIAPSEISSILDFAAACPQIRVRGLMAIPPVSTGEGSNRRYFSALYKLFIDIGAKKYDNVLMDFLSIGMSDDYTDAIMEGANMVRIGSAIFGARHYIQPEI